MKKLKVGVLFAMLALLAISCSYLFEDDEPQNIPLPSPSRSVSKQLELTFLVNDGNGVPKEVKVYVAGKTATLAQIKFAYKSQYPNATPLAGWKTEDSGNWYESDGVTVAQSDKSYPSGAMLSVGLEPIGVGYKASIITAAGNGKVEYLTKDSWTNEQTLKEILEKAGYDSSSDYNPTGSTNPDGLTFKGWAKADEPTTTINPSTDSTTYESGTSFVAVYTGNYSINTGASNNHSLPVNIIAPNTGATLKDIFKAAGVDSVADATSGKPAGMDFAC